MIFLTVDVLKKCIVGRYVWFCSVLTHHPELGLGLLHQIILLRLADAGEDARLWVEVQDVALEICQEVAKTADATDSHHTLE